MPIIFELLVEVHGTSEGGGSLRMRSAGFDAPTTAGIDVGNAALEMLAQGISDGDGSVILVVPDSGNSTLYLGSSGNDGSWSGDTGESAMNMRARGYDALPGDDIGAAAFNLRATGFEFGEYTAYGFFVDQYPQIMGYGGLFYDSIGEGLDVSGALSSDVTAVIRAIIAATAAPVGQFDGIASITEDMEFGDALAVVLRELVQAGFEFNDTAESNFLAVAQVAEALLMTGQVSSMLEAVNAVAAAIAYGTALDAWFKHQLTEGITLDAVVGDALTAAAQLVEGLLIAADGDASVTIGMAISEDLQVQATAGGVLEAMASVREGMAIVLRLTLDSHQYVAYAINTENKGLTQYENYPFNSFARIGGSGGRYYGMTSDGIRLLEGADDDGVPIAWRLRTAMTNLGTGFAKRMESAYLGYASTGDLRIKVNVVGADREREQWTYRLIAQPGDVHEARIQIGQGLKSVYWGFEIEPIDQAEFEMDLIELLPLVVEQRMLGEGGGTR